MQITLTSAELALFSESVQGNESVEQAFHRILSPMIAKHSEARLSRLADLYRGLSQEDQLEALAVLKQWQSSKT
jgi:hypothetical protein